MCSCSELIKKSQPRAQTTKSKTWHCRHVSLNTYRKTSPARCLATCTLPCNQCHSTPLTGLRPSSQKTELVQNRVRTMFEPCSNCVRTVLELCCNDVRTMYEPCSKYVRTMFDICSKRVRAVIEPCPNYVRTVFEPCSNIV